LEKYLNNFLLIINSPNLNLDLIKSVSVAMTGVFKWQTGIYNYCKIYKTIQPKTNQIEEFKKLLEQKVAAL